MLELVIYIYMYFLKKEEDKILLEKLSQLEDQLIIENHTNHVYLRKLVILRSELRSIWYEIVKYSLRMVLLVSNLKLVGHTWLNPIFVSMCGLV